MAFSFGAASSTPAFGASSTPAFGAASSSSGFSFGSTPAFGAASSTPAFGATSSTPAFGQQPAASTPAFGASSTPSFSFSPAPAFGQTAAQPAAAPAFGGFGQLQQQQAQPQAFTQDTKFEDLDKGTQEKLTQIQQQISKYEADRQMVMQLEHLQDNAALQQGLDADTSTLSAELRQLQATIKAEQEGLADFREKAIRLLKSTETVVRTYERTKLWRDAPAMYQRNEPLKPAQQELLQQPVLLPGPTLEESVAGFSSNCAEYSRCLEEVEQVLAASSLQETPAGATDWITALPSIVANMHDYFVAVAAKLERTHAEVHKAKTAYLGRLRARGISADPFESAHRQVQQHLQPQQQQRSAAAAVGQSQVALAALPAAGLAAGAAAGAIVPAAASPQPGGLFQAASPATPAAAGFTGFGSPFVSTATPNPFGVPATAGSLGRSASKGRSGKKR